MMIQSLCLRNPCACLHTRVPSATLPIQGEQDLGPLPVHLPVGLSPIPNWGQGNQILLAIPVGGSMGKWGRLSAPLVEWPWTQWEDVDGPLPDKESPSDAWAIQQAFWLLVVFRLPLAQCEALGWWGAPPRLTGSALSISCPLLMPPALWFSVLQGRERPWLWPICCGPALGVGVLMGILCGLAGELQGCMAPWWLFAVVISWRPLFWVLWQVNQGQPQPRRGCSFRQENWTAPSPRFLPAPAKWSTTLSTSSPSPVPEPDLCPSPRARESWRGVAAGLSHPGRWVCSWLKENDRVPKWWRGFQSPILSPDKHFGGIPVWRVACWWATAFGLPATWLENDGSWTTPPCLGMLVQRDFLPLRDFGELRIME